MNKRRRRITTALLCLCLCLTLFGARPMEAAADTPIIKALATTSYTPVALMDVTYISAAATSQGVYLYDYAWYNARTGAQILEKFGTEQVYVAITLATHDGYEFTDGMSVYLNNSPADYYLSADRHFLTLMRYYDPMIWLPSVIKNPGDEYLQEGGVASFVASASYTEGFQWYACNPADDSVAPIGEIPNAIDIIAGDDGSSKLNIYGVPAWMDGWQVFCAFVGAAGSTSVSARATLHVTPNESLYVEEEPAEEPEAEPGEEAEEEPEEEAIPAALMTPPPTPAPTPVPTPEPTPEPEHVHSFGDFRYDDLLHWRECECGERIEQGAHSYEWTQTQAATARHPGTERGVCTVCGYEVTREVPYAGLSEPVKFAFIGVGGLVGLTVVVLIVDSIVTAVRRKKRGM